MNFAEPVRRVVAATADHQFLTPTVRKWPISYRSVRVIAIAADIVMILFCGITASTMYNFESAGITTGFLQYLASSAIVAALFVLMMRSRNLYAPAELLSLKSQVVATTATWIGVFLFLSGVAFALKVGAHFSRGATFSFAASGLVLLIAQRLFWHQILGRGLSNQKFTGRKAVLITDNVSTATREMTSRLLTHGYQLHRQFILPDFYRDKAAREEIAGEIISYLRGSDVDEVVVGVDVKRWAKLDNLLSELRVLPLPVSLIPVGVASDILSRPFHAVGQSVCIELQRGPLGSFERGAKRCLDVIAALSGLFVLSPLLLIIACLIKLDSKGPVLFRQKRCGFNGRQFHIFKFRTMSVLEDGPVVQQASRADSRITRLGHLLRRTSIDELPQLLNVLSGTMSLIGPRPHALAHDNQFDKAVSNYAFRHHVKPGLTGWAQVNGQRGPTPTVADIRRRVEYDLWYIDNWSLRLDLLIICRTFLEVIRCRNAF
jgi:Undecaprenyl-phosphate glucose phosphotransferase